MGTVILSDTFRLSDRPFPPDCRLGRYFPSNLQTNKPALNELGLAIVAKTKTVKCKCSETITINMEVLHLPSKKQSIAALRKGYNILMHLYSSYLLGLVTILPSRNIYFFSRFLFIVHWFICSLHFRRILYSPCRNGVGFTSMGHNLESIRRQGSRLYRS